MTNHISLGEPASLPDQIPPRRFQYADDKSYKFWTIAIDGNSLTTQFGRIGNPGQTREVVLASPMAAKVEYIKRVKRKLKAGYEERVPSQKNLSSAEEAWQKLESHESFLQAILEEPDEFAGYAIYADWLSEHNDPRGEFTRLQLELENSNLALYQRTRIEKSAAALEQRHKRAWLGHLAPDLMDRGLRSHGYSFFRGQLSSIHCSVLGLEFASELRRSPHCRFLRELSIHNTEVLSEPQAIDGRRFEADREYGLATLVGAEFSNLRMLRIGILPLEQSVGFGVWAHHDYLLELLEKMPRLETIYLGTNFDIRKLFQPSLPQLKSLHLRLDKGRIVELHETGALKQLEELGILNQPSNDLIRKLVEVPGFESLTHFTFASEKGISDSTVSLLESTGVTFQVLD